MISWASQLRQSDTGKINGVRIRCCAWCCSLRCRRCLKEIFKLRLRRGKQTARASGLLLLEMLIYFICVCETGIVTETASFLRLMLHLNVAATIELLLCRCRRSRRRWCWAWKKVIYAHGILTSFCLILVLLLRWCWIVIVRLIEVVPAPFFWDLLLLWLCTWWQIFTIIELKISLVCFGQVLDEFDDWLKCLEIVVVLSVEEWLLTEVSHVVKIWFQKLRWVRLRNLKLLQVQQRVHWAWEEQICAVGTSVFRRLLKHARDHFAKVKYEV